MVCSTPPDKSLFNKDFLSWKTKIADFINDKDPESWYWFQTTERYELPRLEGTFQGSTAPLKSRAQMSVKEREEFDKDSSVYKMITMCLPNEVISRFNKDQSLSAMTLWDTLKEVYGQNDKSKKRSNVVVKEEPMVKKEEEMLIKKEEEMLIKKEEEIKALQAQLLNMKTENEEMRSKVAGMEKQLSDFEDQQPTITKLKEDHDLALRTIQDLREQITQFSHSHPTSVKDVKKIYPDKSSKPCSKTVCAKKVSQFTNYSLQKNKKYSKKSQSTKMPEHQNVDCGDDSVSVLRLQKQTNVSKPTQPESSQTKSFKYTRAQLCMLAPTRSYHTVPRRQKDFVPFSPTKKRLALVSIHEFRHETMRFNFRWNSMSLETYRRLSKISRQIGTVLKWVPKVVV